MEDIEALLTDSQVLLRQVENLHRQSVESGELVEPIRPRIKNVLEHQHSVLDYLTCATFERLGSRRAPRKIYFPKARKPNAFTRNFDANLPGIRVRYPRVFEAFEHHQPYHENMEWLSWLGLLVNGNKHRRLSLQTPEELDVWRSPIAEFRGCTFIREGEEPTSDPRSFVRHLDVDPTWEHEKTIEWHFKRPSAPSAVAVLDRIQRGVEAIVREVHQVVFL